jgi:hypothetical protein
MKLFALGQRILMLQHMFNVEQTLPGYDRLTKIRGKGHHTVSFDVSQMFSRMMMVSFCSFFSFIFTNGYLVTTYTMDFIATTFALKIAQL